MVKKNQGKAKYSFILLCFFLCEQTFPQSLSAENVSESSSSPDFSITDFISQVPSSYGSVSEKYQGSKGRFILHIQDPHAQFEAQKNIAQVISIFSKVLPKGNIPLILVEGAQGMVDVSPLACIQDKETRERISECFLKRGWLSGAEYYAIMNLEEPILFGIEERELYLKNFDYFKKAQLLKKEFSQTIEHVQSSFENAKTRIFSKDLLKLNDCVSSYNQGQLSLEKYASFLKKVRKKKDSLKQTYPSFFNFLRMTSLQKKIDTKASNEEIKNLLIRLQSQLSQENLKKLVEETLLQKLNKISQSDFFKFLYHLSLKENIDWSNYPNLKRFVRILSLRDDISFPDFSKELKTLENEIRSSLYRNEEEKDLDQFFLFLEGLKNFGQLNFSHEEFQTYLKGKGLYFAEKWKMLIDKFSSESTSFVQQDFLKSLLEKCSTIEGFYETAVKRDQAILSKAFDKIKEEKASCAVLITGGFHTAGLTQGFKSEHISYVVMTPTLSSKVNDSAYLSVMNGVLTPFDSGFKSLSQALAPASSFALNPFGNAIPWETIFAQAMMFQEFLEKLRDTRGENLVKGYEHYVRIGNKSGYQRRIPIGEIKRKLEKMKGIAQQLQVDWASAVFLGKDFFVPVKVGLSERVIQIKKRPLDDEDEEKLGMGLYEEIGQFGKDISFCVWPREMHEIFKHSPKNAIDFIEDLFRSEEGEYYITNQSIEKGLRFCSVEDLHQLGRRFKHVRVMHLFETVVDSAVRKDKDFGEIALAFVQGQIQALNEELQSDQKYKAEIARLSLIKLYDGLTRYHMQIEGDVSLAKDYCLLGLSLADGRKGISDEMDFCINSLQDLRQSVFSVWTMFYQDQFHPMAFVLEGRDGNGAQVPEMTEKEMTDKMQWLKRMAQYGFREGDGVFLTGILARPFLATAFPVRFKVSAEYVQLAQEIIKLFRDKGIELHLHSKSADSIKGEQKDFKEERISIAQGLKPFYNVVVFGNMENGKANRFKRVLAEMADPSKERTFYFIGPPGELPFNQKYIHVKSYSLPEKYARTLFEGVEGLQRVVKGLLEGPIQDVEELTLLFDSLKGFDEFEKIAQTQVAQYLLDKALDGALQRGDFSLLFGKGICMEMGESGEVNMDQVRIWIKTRPVELWKAFLSLYAERSLEPSLYEDFHRRERRIANSLTLAVWPNAPQYVLSLLLADADVSHFYNADDLFRQLEALQRSNGSSKPANGAIDISA